LDELHIENEHREKLNGKNNRVPSLLFIAEFSEYLFDFNK